MNFYDLEPAHQRRASTARLLRYLRDYVQPYHPFLRKLYRESGVAVDKLRTPDDLRSLPIVDKVHLQSDPLAFILRPTVAGGPPLPPGYDTEPLRKATKLKYALQTLLNVPKLHGDLVRASTFRERVRRRGLLEWQPIHSHVSTGSTGSPTPATFTHYDLTKIVAELASNVVRPKHPNPEFTYFDWSDRAMNIFPGAPHMAFFSPVLAKMLAGFSSFETFGGGVIPTDRQVALFAQGGFSQLTAVPSYLVHWLRRANALRELGVIGPLKDFKQVVVGAEPLSESLRERIRQLAFSAGADPRFRVFQTVGMTEMKWGFFECGEGNGVHLNPKYYYWEILDTETREPVAAGEPGVLVFSHIGWRGTVLIRYWTGDLIKGGLTWDRCKVCGYTFPTIHPPICRAKKDFTKIKGTRADLSLLVETVRDTPGVRDFQATLDSDESGRDRLAIQVVLEPGRAQSTVESDLRLRLKTCMELSPDRVSVEPDEQEMKNRLFTKSPVKAEFIVDKRENQL